MWIEALKVGLYQRKAQAQFHIAINEPRNGVPAEDEINEKSWLINGYDQSYL